MFRIAIAALVLVFSQVEVSQAGEALKKIPVNKAQARDSTAHDFMNFENLS